MRKWLVSLIVIFGLPILGSFLLYGNTLRGEFLYDDVFFAQRTDLSSWSAPFRVFGEPYLPGHRTAGVYRPLTVATFAVNFILFGRSPVSFHVVNIFLHGLATALVFLTIRQFFPLPVAVLTSLLFLVLPVHTEAVASAKSRDELLAALFGMIAYLLYSKAIRATRKRSFFMAAGSLSYGFAILSKETSIVLPIMFLAVNWTQSTAPFAKLLRILLPFALVLLLVLAFRVQILGPSAFGTDDSQFVINPLRNAPVNTRIFTAFKLLTGYLAVSLVPLRLSATYAYNYLPMVTDPGRSAETIIGIGVLAAILVILASRRLRGTPLGIGVWLFLIPYAMVSKFIFSGGDLFAERWMYLPSVGLCLILAAGLRQLQKHFRPLGMCCAGLLLLFYSARTLSRNSVWLSSKTLFASMITDAPESIQGYYGMAWVSYQDGALLQSRAFADRGLAIYADYAPLRNISGALYLAGNDFDRAAEEFRLAARADPQLVSARMNLVKLAYLRHNWQEAAEGFNQVFSGLSGGPELGDVIAYAESLSHLGKYSDSNDLVRRFAGENPANAKLRFILAVNHWRLGLHDIARKFFRWEPGLTEKEAQAAIDSF